MCERAGLEIAKRPGGPGPCDPVPLCAPEESAFARPGRLSTARVLPLALTESGLIDEDEFVVQPRLWGHGPTLFAGVPKHVDLRLVSRVEFGSGTVAMRYEPRR